VLLKAANESPAEKRAKEADALVARAQSGDPAAFDALVRRFRPRIYALALHLTASASDADDVTQESFVEAYRHITRFEGRSQFFTWLYRITVNKALNARRQGTRQSASLDDERLTFALRADAKGDPRLALELRDTYLTLLNALDRMPSGLRSAVVLTIISGLSYEEAAVVLNTSAGAVAVRIHEARKELRRALEESQRTQRTKWHKKGRHGRALSAPSLDLAAALASLL